MAGGNQAGADVLKKIKSSIIVFVRNEDSGTTEIWKKSLAGASAYFAKQIGTSSKPVWNSTARYEYRDDNSGVASGVLATDYAVGYSVLGVALKLKLKSAMILKPGSTTPIRASAAAVEFAVAEMGLGEAYGPSGYRNSDVRVSWQTLATTVMLLNVSRPTS